MCAYARACTRTHARAHIHTPLGAGPSLALPGSRNLWQPGLRGCKPARMQRSASHHTTARHGIIRWAAFSPEPLLAAWMDRTQSRPAQPGRGVTIPASCCYIPGMCRTPVPHCSQALILQTATSGHATSSHAGLSNWHLPQNPSTRAWPRCMIKSKIHNDVGHMIRAAWAFPRG